MSKWGSSNDNFEKIGKKPKFAAEEDRKTVKKGRTTDRASARKGKAWTRAVA